MSSIPLYSDDFPDITSFKNTNISIPKVKPPSISKSNAQINSNQSAKGFCSVEQAADKLLRKASNPLGFSGLDLIEDYAEQVKKDCGPFRYIPQEIKSPDEASRAPFTFVCYELRGECGNDYESDSYNPSNCALKTEKNKLIQIYERLSNERDKKVSEHIKKVREIAMLEAKKIVSRKITKKLADNPFEQVKLSWADICEMRRLLASRLAEKYSFYYLSAALNAVGEVVVPNIDYLSPIIALAGPVGFVVVSGLPITEETFQCNISIKNMFLKGGLSAANKLIVKVPIIKTDNVVGVFADRFVKNVTTEEASKWVKHYFGDGLEAQNVSVVKEYGKKFAIITIKSVIGTGNYYSNKSK